jgi:hypothetical protein
MSKAARGTYELFRVVLLKPLACRPSRDRGRAGNVLPVNAGCHKITGRPASTSTWKSRTRSGRSTRHWRSAAMARAAFIGGDRGEARGSLHDPQLHAGGEAAPGGRLVSGQCAISPSCESPAAATSARDRLGRLWRARPCGGFQEPSG